MGLTFGGEHLMDKREIGEGLSKEVTCGSGAPLLVGTVVESVEVGGENFLFAPL